MQRRSINVGVFVTLSTLLGLAVGLLVSAGAAWWGYALVLAVYFVVVAVFRVLGQAH